MFGNTINFSGIIVAGGIGNGIEQVTSSVEFLDLAKKKKWDLLASMKKPRCCWPQLGFLGSSNNDLLILSGEETPSKSVESFNLTSEAWNIERNLLIHELGLGASCKRENCTVFRQKDIYDNDLES